LHVSTLWFPDASYKNLELKKDFLKKEIEISEISDFILSCFDNTKDVKNSFLNLTVWSKNYEALNGKLTVHFSVIDENGDEIIIEFIDGKLKIFENYFGILTNNPSFDWHSKNLRNYIKLDAKSIEEKEIKNLIFKQNGFGNGLFGIPGDFTSSSRFVRAFYLKNFIDFYDEMEEETIFSYLSTLINNLIILPGYEKSAKDYTQWHILLLNNEKLLVKFFDKLNYIEIDLKKIFQKEKNGYEKYLRNFEKKKNNFFIL